MGYFNLRAKLVICSNMGFFAVIFIVLKNALLCIARFESSSLQLIITILE